MFRRKLRPNTDPRAGELRAMFVANRDRVQSWPTNWDFPEVAWPEISAIPSPYGVLPDEERDVGSSSARLTCLNTGWLLEPRPLHHQHQPGRLLFVFVEVSRYPYSRTEIEVQVIVTEVSATLDGTPLDDTGRPIS